MHKLLRVISNSNVRTVTKTISYVHNMNSSKRYLNFLTKFRTKQNEKNITAPNIIINAKTNTNTDIDIDTFNIGKIYETSLGRKKIDLRPQFFTLYHIKDDVYSVKIRIINADLALSKNLDNYDELKNMLSLVVVKFIDSESSI